MPTNSRLAQQTADQKLADGVQKYLGTLPSLTVGSQKLSPADVTKVLQDRIASSVAAQAATVARTDAVNADRNKRGQSARLVKALKRLVQGMYSESAETLAAFGLQPTKVGTRTVATKAGAVAKSAATRVARNTMGKRQKENVKGTPPATTTAPTAPPTTSTSAHPTTVTPSPVAPAATPPPAVTPPVATPPPVAVPKPAPNG